MRTFVITFLSVLITSVSFAQCKSFTKNTCRPILEDFIPNENFNSTMLIPGDEAELKLTFYGGQEYRLVVCGHPVLGEVQFTVLDNKKNELYARRDGNQSNFFDFKLEATQQFHVLVNVPLSENVNELIHEGCVSIMVGYKEAN
jgi:hypothetical protein